MRGRGGAAGGDARALMTLPSRLQLDASKNAAKKMQRELLAGARGGAARGEEAEEGSRWARAVAGVRGAHHDRAEHGGTGRRAPRESVCCCYATTTSPTQVPPEIPPAAGRCAQGARVY